MPPDTSERRSLLLRHRDAVLDCLPEKGRLLWVIDVQAKARGRLTRSQVLAALKSLEADGLVVHRAPFDIGRPDRWGRA